MGPCAFVWACVCVCVCRLVGIEGMFLYACVPAGVWMCVRAFFFFKLAVNVNADSHACVCRVTERDDS